MSVPTSDPDELKFLVPQGRRSVVDDPRRAVWVPDPAEGFARAYVLSENGDHYEVEMGHSHARLKVSVDECQKANPAKFHKAANMADLTCLNDASVLHNLKERYLSGLIYTYSGLFCVVVNPYRKLPIYTDQIMKFYKGKRQEDVPPHVFAITDRAYRAMLLDRNDQSILCTGESGAGKTENTKKVIQYLAFVAKSPRTSTDRQSRASADLELQLLQANPILESFGNARTVKNDNSSRFGKFIRISFDSVGFIAGGTIETYLLEKSRTVRQTKNERNFHIFYQLLRSFKSNNNPDLAHITDLLLLDRIDLYSYISNGNIELPESDDIEQFAATIKALKILETSNEQITGICATLSAILLMGNLEFVNDRDSSQAIMPDDTIAQKIACLLGVNVIEFTRSILSPKVKCGREVICRAQDKKQVEFAIEAVAKTTYEQLFKWILAKINKTLNRAAKRQSAYFIGILDIAGFEIFDVNSFEQLCINYTNEKLQQLFNHTMFVLEQREYEKEEIEWKFIDFALDLQPSIDLIEKGTGVLPLLDEECVFPNSTDRTYVDKLISLHSTNKNFLKPNVRSKHDFSIIHYAGAVNYCVDQWLMKNTDPINDNIVHLLQNSQNAFMRDIWKSAELITIHGQDAAPIKTSIKKGMFRTVGQMYKDQLNSLMNILHRTTPNFIRCIIPNIVKSANRMEPNLVLSQLRCNGVLEGIRICRHGFPNRIPFQEFRHRYEVLCPSLVPQGFADGRVVCEKLLNELELDGNLYRIGQTKIFFRAGVLAHLEEERDQKISDVVMHIQCLCRGKMARDLFMKRLRKIKSMRIVQRNGRVLLNICDWNWFKLFTKIKPMLNVTRLDQVIQAKERDLAASVSSATRLQAQVEEMGSRMEQLVAERNVAVEDLVQERELNQELSDCRARLLSRKVELEKIVEDLEGRLEDDAAKDRVWAKEKFELQNSLKELRDSLNEEERRRQVLDLQKMSAESAVKKLEEALVGKTGEIERICRTKDGCEQRMLKMEADLRVAGEKTRELVRANVRNEARIEDLDGRLKTEIDMRQKADNSSRAFERDLSESRDQLAECRQEIEELRLSIAKKDRELAVTNGKIDEHCSSVSSFLREIRDLKEQLAEVHEDLKSEQEARKSADIDRRDLSEENEALRNEITGHSDTNALMQDQFKKREEEVNDLRKKLIKEQEDKLEAVQAVKARLGDQLKGVSEELLVSQRNWQTLVKEKGDLIGRLAERDDELAKAHNVRDSVKNRLKTVEADLQEKSESLRANDQSRHVMEAEIAQSKRIIEHLQNSQVSLENRISEANGVVHSLKNELEKATARLEEEIDGRQVLEGRIVTLNGEVDSLSGHLNEKESECSRLSAKMHSLVSAVNETRSQCQSEAQIQLDDQRRGFQREKEALLVQVQDLKVQIDRAVASKAKIQNELADASVELDRYRSSYNVLDKNQKQIDRKLADERILQEKLRGELESSERENREKETRLLNLQYELKDKDELLNQSETRLKQVRGELEDALSGKDDVGRSVCGLERMNRNLQQQNEECVQRMNELESELSLSENAKLRLEVNMNALRVQMERQMIDANEANDDRYRSAMKQLREIENELDEERKARSIAVSAHKKAELDMTDIKVELADLVRAREDDNRVSKRNAIFIKELKEELETSRAAINDTAREWERRYSLMEQVVIQTQEERDELDRVRRTAVNELDELRQEIDQLRSGDSSLSRWSDEKKRLDARISELEDDLSDENNQAGILSEKMRMLAQHNDQLVNELNQERLNVSRAENSREMSDRLVRELKQKLIDIEEQYKSRAKLASTSFESRITSVEQQLEVEQKERQRVMRSLRSTEKKWRELGVRYEEERNACASAREQAENALSRVRQLKKQIDDLEEASAEAANKNRRLQRDRDNLENMVALREQKIRHIETRSSIRAASVTLRNIPSTPSGDFEGLEEDEDDGSSSNTGSSYSNHIPPFASLRNNHHQSSYPLQSMTWTTPTRNLHSKETSNNDVGSNDINGKEK